MIKNLTLKALEKAINTALSLDEVACYKVQELSGKILGITIMPLNVKIFLGFGEKISVLANYEDIPDALIQSNPMGLIRLSLLPASKVRSLFNDEIKITGDVELGQKIKLIFDELDLDWEGHLAHFTGDIVAYQIGSFVKKGLSFANRTTNSLQRNLTEYLQEEIKLVPGKEELEDFFSDIDELALKVERIAAHLEYLNDKQHEIQ